MLKQIDNINYDINFDIEFNDDSVEVYIKYMSDEQGNEVDLKTIDQLSLKWAMAEYYEDYIKGLEKEDQKYWGLDRCLGDVRIENNTAILKHW